MKFGLTQQFGCSYLPDQDEQLLVHVADSPITPHTAEMLVASGFRRSGEQIYRPHCPRCSACQAIRIPVSAFTPSRSQRRILQRNQGLRWQVSHTDKDAYYQLYDQYICARHKDGSMYPPTRAQYLSFVQCSWSEPLFIEGYDDGQLVVVAVTDRFPNSLSALYTFFDPTYAHRSIGTLAILQQITQAQQWQLDFLYLGYQIDACQKMNYKARFYPHERFFDNKWHRVSKKTEV
ncbi:arginyltransferase [Aestuariibacter halophilus]|uniref:Aspartate/glutamate leucyltransferase n=1 Tax=Fluctibacter halophilus TaxID=226011 RepID=A0ABS8G479_9ALTE|nr:arginyltransferase [Aestuariibacter halophilus]MCC2615404.1 arginyltransferase [Aestuariibacter halophilus]